MSIFAGKILMTRSKEHVSQEWSMRYCSQKWQTNRNTPSWFKIDFLFFKYNGFFRYNGFITDFCCFYRFSTFLRTKKSEMPSFLRSAPEGSLMGTWKWVKYQVLGLLEGVLEGGVSRRLKNHVFTVILQACLHSMYHRNYACVFVAKGCKLTVTHPVDLK